MDLGEENQVLRSENARLEEELKQWIDKDQKKKDCAIAIKAAQDDHATLRERMSEQQRKAEEPQQICLFVLLVVSMIVGMPLGQWLGTFRERQSPEDMLVGAFLVFFLLVAVAGLFGCIPPVVKPPHQIL
jgi:hypothetical protein